MPELGVELLDHLTSDFTKKPVCKNSITEDVAQVNDVVPVDMHGCTVPEHGNELIQGGDVIEVDSCHCTAETYPCPVPLFGEMQLIIIAGDW